MINCHVYVNTMLTGTHMTSTIECSCCNTYLLRSGMLPGL